MIPRAHNYFFIVAGRCYTTEIYVYDHFTYYRTVPYSCEDYSYRVQHILDTVVRAAHSERAARTHRLIYLSHGNNFAEAMWVKKERPLIAENSAEFPIPVFIEP